MLKFVFTFFLLTLINSSVKADDSEKVSPADQALIIQKAMEIKLEKDGPEKFSEYLIISTDNMSPELMPRIPGFQFKLMSPREIKKQKANRLRYLVVSEMKQHGNVVNFSLGIIDRCNGNTCYAHRYDYVFEKVDGHWQGRIYLIIC